MPLKQGVKDEYGDQEPEQVRVKIVGPARVDVRLVRRSLRSSIQSRPALPRVLFRCTDSRGSGKSRPQPFFIPLAEFPQVPPPGRHLPIQSFGDLLLQPSFRSHLEIIIDELPGLLGVLSGNEG